MTLIYKMVKRSWNLHTSPYRAHLMFYSYCLLIACVSVWLCSLESTLINSQRPVRQALKKSDGRMRASCAASASTSLQQEAIRHLGLSHHFSAVRQQQPNHCRKQEQAARKSSNHINSYQHSLKTVASSFLP